LTPQQRAAWINGLSRDALEALLYDWDHWARLDQKWPACVWHTWLISAGRGWGKTRTGAETVRQAACGSTPLSGGTHKEIALVGETAADVRKVMIEGPAGILATHPKAFRPKYTPSKRLLEWPNGALAHTYNGTEPDQLRGPQHDFAWADEVAKWQYMDAAWDMLQMGLRLGDPKQVITTTPRPLPLIKQLMKEARIKNSGVIHTQGITLDNRANLADTFIEKILKRYAGTRLGRQELNAEILDDVPGALWTRKTIDDSRLSYDEPLPDMQRVVVGVDPAAKASGEGDKTSETGIIAVGLGVDGKAYVLDDASNRLGPGGWARKAIALFDTYEADRVVAEINQGGEMVERVLRAERPMLPIVLVRASRGKVVRAEPIAALYEQGRVHHVGAHSTLEDQMVLFTPFGIEGDGAGDRVDALVWALSDLFPSMINKQTVNWSDRPGTGNGGGGWLGT
jgi:phage terminase large subunit-like protein